MSFFDELLSTTKNVASTAGKKGDDAVKFSKLKLKVAQINSEIKDKYTKLGEMIYSMAKADEKHTEEFDLMVEEIDALYVKLAETKAALDELRQLVACPGCGAKTKNENCFCPKCGTKLPKPEPKPVEEAATEEAPAAEEKTEAVSIEKKNEE